MEKSVSPTNHHQCALLVQSRWWTRIGKESREIRGNFSSHVQFWRSRGGSRGLGRWRLPVTAESLRAVCSLHIGFDQVNRFLTIFLKIFLQYFVRTIVNIVIFWYWIESFSRYILWMYYLPIVVQWFLLFPLCLLSHAKFPGVSAGERFPADAPENVSRMADGRENVFPFCQCTDGRWSPCWQMIARSQHCERSVTRIPNDKSRPAWWWKTNPKNPQKVKGPGHGAQLVSDLSQKHSNLLQNFNFEITCVGFTEPKISIEWNDGETYLTTGLLGEACLYWKPFQFFKHC